MAPSLNDLQIKLFLDGADLDAMREAVRSQPWIRGFTTNPTLMRKGGVSDYEAFARSALEVVGSRPISFEVFSDDFAEMAREARIIGSWAPSVFVKIPITNTKGDSSVPLIDELAADGIPLNVTAVFTMEQVTRVSDAIGDKAPAIISVFAGRIADTGRDPMPMMSAASKLTQRYDNQELLWASPRELLNIFQADTAGTDIITATPDVLGKLGLIGADLDARSLETVEMFHEDAKKAGYRLLERAA